MTWASRLADNKLNCRWLLTLAFCLNSIPCQAGPVLKFPKPTCSGIVYENSFFNPFTVEDIDLSVPLNTQPKVELIEDGGFELIYGTSNEQWTQDVHPNQETIPIQDPFTHLPSITQDWLQISIPPEKELVGPTLALAEFYENSLQCTNKIRLYEAILEALPQGYSFAEPASVRRIKISLAAMYAHNDSIEKAEQVLEKWTEDAANEGDYRAAAEYSAELAALAKREMRESKARLYETLSQFYEREKLSRLKSHE